MDADDEASFIHARAENADETGEGRVCRRRTFFDDAGACIVSRAFVRTPVDRALNARGGLRGRASI